MSGTIINRDPQDDCVTIETAQGKSEITIQQYQHIYSLITGKNEQISKDSKKNIRVTLEDFRHLDLKIRQLLEQYKIVGSAATYAIYYNNDQKEVSSTFDRFALTAASPNSLTQNVTFTYKFSILLPFVNQAQNYSLAITVNNKWAIREKMFTEVPNGTARKLFRFFAADTIELKLEYIDYAVTRTVISAFDEWVDSLEESKQNTVLTFLKNHSEAIPKITKYFTLLFLTWGLVEAAPVYLKNANSFWEFTQISVPIIFISYLIINFSISLGKLIENSLDNTEPPSYICITRGDTKAATEANNANKGELIKAAITGTISSAFSVLTKYVTTIFGLFS